MKQTKVKRIHLTTNNNDLVYAYLPSNYLEVTQIKDVENPIRKQLEAELKNAKTDREKQRITERIAKLKFIKEVYYTIYSDISYEKLVAKLVAEKYNQAEESAIQRKAIMNGITDEFLIYNAYVEDCKVRAKKFIAEREGANK